MEYLEIKIAALVFAGIVSQWLAWRFKIPAIALLLIAGLVAGPLTGLVSPKEDFGETYKIVITLSVAIILFEGGLTLNFAEIRETSKGVRRIVLLGAPLVWIFGTLAGHYGGGLSWPTASILGAILVVTGPTVIMPLLRQANLQRRVSSLLRWEAIINDPIGALLAVLCFEVFLILNTAHSPGILIGEFILMLILALPCTWLLGRGIIWLYTRGHMPEFLKTPFLLVTVMLSAAATNLVFEEAGLLTVTVLGIVLANSRLASLQEMRRFKETVTILLVSTVFITLTATLEPELLFSLGWEAITFLILVLLFVRPAAIWLATIGTGLTWQERAMTAFIAPRGIVAVAVAGLFGDALINNGVEDGGRILAYTFAVVATTILLHGFGLPFIANILKLRSVQRPGVLMVGSTPFSIAFAAKLKEQEVPVLIADRNWFRLKNARDKDLATYYGDVLSEHAHHHININDWAHSIALSDNDAYNALVCSELGPEIGRGNVFQIGERADEGKRQELLFTIGGRPLFKSKRTYSELNSRIRSGWKFSFVRLSDEYTLEDLKRDRSEDADILLWINARDEILFNGLKRESEPKAGDQVLIFDRERKPQNKSKRKIANE